MNARATPPTFFTGSVEPLSDANQLKDWTFEINTLNAQYARVLDEGHYQEWPNFFIECAQYKIQARENYDRALPLCIVDLESKGMMKDRIYGITETIFHAPYYSRHIISQSLILGLQTASNAHEGVRHCIGTLSSLLGPQDKAIEPICLLVSTSNYGVYRTKPGKTSEVFNVGQYIDHWLVTSEGLKIASRQCIYDSEMILNSLIYPL
jgi:salicylate 5-hydroxylase small subunit